MPHTQLMIPVPALDDVVRPRLARRAPDQPPPDDDVPAAHITLLAPFAPLDQITDGILDELYDLFADVTPFPFELTGVHRFPDGAVYLAPDPARPFRQLTHELIHRFPEYPPSGGAFGSVVPHLSVPTHEGEDEHSLARQLAARLPITAHAREATLTSAEEGRCRTVASFPFGTSAA